MLKITRTKRSMTASACSCRPGWNPCVSSALYVPFFAIVACILPACGRIPSPSPYADNTTITRNALLSQELAQQAVAIISTNKPRAEELLKEALAEDLYNGPAHNNLGVLYLTASPPRLYEAASEFEWACKLMPGQPDPRFNRALVFERAGRSDDAVSAYATTLEVTPQYMPALQGRASLMIRLGRADDATQVALGEIALRGTTEHWREWAKMRLARRD